MIELLACVGLTFILKYGTILNIPRNYLTKLHSSIEQLFKCSLCLGFWSGVAVYFVNQTTPLLPLASAATCWGADSLVGVLQYLEIKLEKEHNR